MADRLFCTIEKHIFPVNLIRFDLENQESKPKWLAELQDKSWEPEVILSGIVLFGMFKLPGLLDDFLLYFGPNFAHSNQLPDIFINFLKIACFWLTGGLIAHLISRGVWVGMIGLSFTFPEGIQRGKLKLKNKYRSSVEKIPATEQIILKLERFSSALFSFSFMMFMIMIGGYVFMLTTFIIPIIALQYLPAGLPLLAPPVMEYVFVGYFILIFLISLIGTIDFITLGFIKNIKWLNKIYWPIYRIVGFLTLSKFYRPIYYVLITNVKRWKIVVGLLFFVVTSFVWINSSIDSKYPNEKFSMISIWSDDPSTMAYTGYYDDQAGGLRSIDASIQSDIIKGSTLKLFLVLRADREDSIRAYCNLDSLLQVKDLPRSKAQLQCLADFYSISINDSVVADLAYKFHYKTSSDQRGILTYIDIGGLEYGYHSLDIHSPENMQFEEHIAHIPFYRERNEVVLDTGAN